MSNSPPTDHEIARDWFEACADAREEIARRQRLIDAMRAAGIAKKPEAKK